MHTETIEAEGHLIDSHLLEAVFDKVIEHGARFEIVKFDIGRTNEQFSHLVMKVHAGEAAVLGELLEDLLALGCWRTEQADALLRACDQDACAPEDFYSTTNHRTQLLQGGKWITVERQRMDAAIVLDDGRAVCIRLRDLRAGDMVVCGSGGLRVLPDFKERNRISFGFMSSDVSSERRVELAAARTAELMRRTRTQGGRIVVVAGPVVVHTGAADALAALIRLGYVNVLLAGNALAVHDAEHSLFGTSLGIHLERGVAAEYGHRNHMRAVNLVRRAGGLRTSVQAGLLCRGVLYECVRRQVPFVLAGSIRDDGPVPETITDMNRAQDLYAQSLEDAALVLCLGTMLHSIGVANMLPSWVPLVAVDINPAVVTKIADRGSPQTIGLVTDVGLFLHLLEKMLAQ